ncbi:MAG TPA: tRNA preQ1(34) S-adenosylmethionine ribosyltransferase-isomerase QueA [Clostridiales bacterium]|nr:MAG: tRNA preQ1(34) S-adenosylmethionine ribosyltransferase-isomerase QueA [Clostridiales bacterium GWD2_32_59]HAN09074.1 tRNA preQ1(34) S-adenosylmethionine ribosyltransferase-isomerase QueA [Clostridiales bacterium]
MDTIYFVTGNKGKVISMQNHVGKYGIKVEQYKLKMEEIQSDNVEDISVHKAQQAFNILKKPVIVEDSGFFIECFNGFPGVYIKYILNTIGINGILDMMKEKENRRCTFKSVLTFIDDQGVPRTFKDDGDGGTIAHEVNNTDCEEAWSDLWKIFIPSGATKTLNALTGDERERIFKEWENKSVFTQFAKWMDKKYNNLDVELDNQNNLLSSAFQFNLPEEKIANKPRPVGEHKLLIYDRKTDTIKHCFFDKLVDELPANALIVINNSKVVKAALRYLSDDGRYLHILNPLHESLSNVEMLCPWKPHTGDMVSVNGGIVKITGFADENRDIRTTEIIPHDTQIKTLPDFIDKYGEVPIPIYINAKRRLEVSDIDDYQNIYAKVDGSVACPTAGLHFNEDLIKKLKAKGIKFAEITLHVGYGTWKSFKYDNIKDHKMDSEHYIITKENMKLIYDAVKQKTPILAVGTTSVRTLETVADTIINCDGNFKDLEGDSEIFIYPPYNFKLVNWLITNFAYPKTPIMTIPASMCGLQKLKHLYSEALESDYLFYTYGDAMMIK